MFVSVFMGTTWVHMLISAYQIRMILFIFAYSYQYYFS